MICPQCRNETPGSPCDSCGLERETALQIAAETSERLLNWKRAFGYWSEIGGLKPNDSFVQQGMARCLVHGYLDSPGTETFERVEELLVATWTLSPTWEEGYDLRLRLHERNGSLDRLAEAYEQGPPAFRARAKLVRLIIDFKGKKAGDVTCEHRRRLWMKWSSLILGIALIWSGSELVPGLFANDLKVWAAVLPVALIVFGIVFAIGSAIVLWKTPRRSGSGSRKEEEA